LSDFCNTAQSVLADDQLPRHTRATQQTRSSLTLRLLRAGDNCGNCCDSIYRSHALPVIASHAIQSNEEKIMYNMHWTKYKITWTSVRPASVDKIVTLRMGRYSSNLEHSEFLCSSIWSSRLCAHARPSFDRHSQPSSFCTNDSRSFREIELLRCGLFQ